VVPDALASKTGDPWQAEATPGPPRPSAH
jgi:hypothetical protein